MITKKEARLIRKNAKMFGSKHWGVRDSKTGKIRW